MNRMLLFLHKSCLQMPLWGAILAGALLAAPQLWANQSTAWELCECENELYSLRLIGEGTFTINPQPADPENPRFARGQYVAVGFTPGENRSFIKWRCTPRSHMASGDTSVVTGLFITEFTTLVAETEYKSPSPNLYVSWDHEHGSVLLPEGAYYSGWNMGEPCVWTLPLTSSMLGGTMNLHAIPNEGYHVVWGTPYVPGECGARMENPIALRPESTTYLKADFYDFNGQSPSCDTVNVNTVGGAADIWIAGGLADGPGTDHYAPCPSIDMLPGSGSMNIRPVGDQYVSYITWIQDGTEVVHYPEYELSGDLYKPKSLYMQFLTSWALNFTAHLFDAINLNVETEGHGIVRSNDFAHDWNPMPRGGNSVIMYSQPCPGWLFDHWEYKNAAGVWVYVPVNLSDTRLYIHMDWRAGANNEIHVPNGQKTFNVKAVFSKIPLLILEPNGSPITDNHYSFSEFLTGSCGIHPTATSGVGCGYNWILPAMDGATITTIPNPPDSKSPELFYSGLPASNSQFGERLLTVTRLDGSDAVSTPIQIFFTETASNHPPLTPQEQEDMIFDNYATNVPNWFYYWRQTSANFGSPRLGSGSTYNYDSTDHVWFPIIGSDANTTYCFPTIYPNGTGNPVKDYDGVTILYWISWDVAGIDKYALCARHETCHAVQMQQDWPNGYTHNNSQDLDHDYIPDADEAGYNYSSSTPDSNFDSHSDQQDLCLRTQMFVGSIYYWVPGSANAEDWSASGKQSTLL